MASWTRWCAVVLCLLSGWALGMVELDAGTRSTSVARELRYYRDDSASLNLDQALSLPAARWASVRWGILDNPSARKVHSIPIPRLGGVAMVGVEAEAWFARCGRGLSPHPVPGPSGVPVRQAKYGRAFFRGTDAAA